MPQALRKNAVLGKYIPETRPLTKFNPTTQRHETDLEELKGMVAKYKVVYLKPRWGMRSEGIIRVRQDNNGEFEYNFTKNFLDTDGENYITWASKEMFPFKTTTLKEVVEATRSIREGYPDYIIQQGIDIPKDSQMAELELRLLFQRGPSGPLSLIGWNEVQKKPWRDALIRKFGSKNGEVILLNLENSAKVISMEIQSKFGPNFAQMTVQMGIGSDGKPMLVEVNPKPGVGNTFEWYGAPEMTARSTFGLTKFLEKASGFSSDQTTPGIIEESSLKDGTTAQMREELNPFRLYQFAQKALGIDILTSQRSVYNLRSLEHIKENMASRARYLTLTSGGEVLGCIALLRPFVGMVRGTGDTTKILETKKRWEIGGVLVLPQMRGKGIAKKLFETAIKQLQTEGISEAMVRVTGTYDINKIGVPREESRGIERLVGKFNPRLIGYAVYSYGPCYVVKIPEKKT